MKRETELNYVTGHGSVDSPSRWGSEAGYFKGLGDDSDTSSWVDAFTQVLPAVAGVIQQKQFNDANIALINSGKPPMSAQQYIAANPATAQAIAAAQPSPLPKIALYIGVALVGLVGLKMAGVIK